MKILVCVSKTPDTTAKITFKSGFTELDAAAMGAGIMNPYDEWYALVRGIELAEQHAGSKVTIVTVGGADAEPMLRKGLAIGADQALRIDAVPTSAYFVASQIAKYAKAFDIVLLGKETIDFNGAEVSSMLAEMIEMPFVSFATHLKIDGNTATVTREIEGGKEIVAVQLPLVLSAAKGLAEQRIPNMKGIAQARTKPLAVRPAVPLANTVTTLRYEMPPAKATVKLVSPDNIDELVRLLHEEAKVI